MAAILIIDDQAHVRELLSEELADVGYHVSGTGHGESIAHEIARVKPDLVILDLYLCGYDAFELLRDIKQQNPGLPVIIHTAYDSFKGDPRLSGAQDYVIKNSNLCELKERIDCILKGNK